MEVARKRHTRDKKAKPIQLATCYLDGGDPVDTRLLHEHHKIPQGFGGKDTQDNRVWLCGSCHDHVHRIAPLLLSGQLGIANDLMIQAFPNAPATRLKLKDLAETAAKAMREYVPHVGDTEDDDDVVVVQIHMSRSLHNKLKTLAMSHSNKKSKRRVGLYHYILTVLKNHVQVANTRVLNQDLAQLYSSVPKPDQPLEPEVTPQDLFYR